jgi:hypothetical protein
MDPLPWMLAAAVLVVVGTAAFLLGARRPARARRRSKACAEP